MSEISDAIQTKCLAFGDRIIKLNDYLLEQAANKKPGYKNANENPEGDYYKINPLICEIARIKKEVYYL